MRLSPLCLIPVGLAALVGCSDPVPPTPRAAWNVQFSDPGIDCNIGVHAAEVGSVTSNKKDLLLTDGIEGADVSCTVAAAGTGFNIDASASQKNRFLLLAVDGISASATEEAPAKGILSYSSVNTIKSFSSSGPNLCSLYFIPGSGEGIDKGKVWFAFKCPMVTDGGNTCEITQGHAIFENCNE